MFLDEATLKRVLETLRERHNRRTAEVLVCRSARSKKHMQIRADEIGMVLADIKGLEHE